MTGTGRTLGTLFGSVVAAAACATAQPAGMPNGGGPPSGGLTSPGSPNAKAAMPGPAMSPPMGTAGPARVVLSDVVDPGFRDPVLAVVRKPTLATRGATEEVVSTPAVYEWLLDHPDRVSLAWRRLKVPCVEINDLGGGKFAWSDGEGSDLVWQTVGRFPDGRVWYATGKVKPSPVTPTVPVRAVVVVTHPRKPNPDGTAGFAPVAQVYIQTDSKAANLLLRTLGPTAAKLAQEGAEQLLFFFNGIARHVQAHPDKAEELLGPARR